MSLRIAVYDCETKPNVVHTWGLWQQNVAINQIVQPGGLISFAWKWHGDPKVRFHSDHHDGHKEMLDAAWNMFDQADAVVTFNGLKFDDKHMRTEMLLAGMTPPAPIPNIDLCREVKRNFMFPSNKLQYVSRALGLKGKLQTGGHELWTACMAGEEKAWARMKKYNMQDVRLTDELFGVLKPWIRLPNVGLVMSTDTRCPGCGSTNLERRGFHDTLVSRFQRYRCRDCGRWPRSGKALERVDLR